MTNSLDRFARRAVNPILATFNLKDRRTRHKFSNDAPTAQAAVDIFANEWITAFPPHLGVVAGSVNHFDPQIDPRVSWVESHLPNGLKGLSVLELGPFEAYQTALIEQAGAASVLAVEGSQTAYLKCLIVKELLNLHAKFLYGDILKFLAQDSAYYDIVWASGILYHQPDPIGLLEQISTHTDRIFLHTHFFDSSRPLPPKVASRMNSAGDERITWRGKSLHLHRHEYADATITNRFAGGPRQYALWMEQADIEFVLRNLGFDNLTYGVVDVHNPNGPAMFLLASRK